MIDREKVIKALEVCSSIPEGEECPKECPYRGQDMYCIGSAGLMLDALDLLKKQEPALPTWRQGKAYCGECGQRLPRKRADMEINYCGYCGHEVKWND